MKVIYYGHACFSVVVGGKTLLFDPFISGNPLAKDIDVKIGAGGFHPRFARARGPRRPTRWKSPDAPARW